MPPLTRSLLFVSLLISASCQQPKQDAKVTDSQSNTVIPESMPSAINILRQYDFDRPTQLIKLPKELKELSGIRFINDSMLVMISDSKPDVFFYNTRQNSIVKQIRVGSKGDFEDIAVVDDKIFVLQSNGVIWTISQFNESPSLSSDSLPLQQPFELEGLSTNEKGDSLYIAAKYWHLDDIVPEGTLPVWAWSVSDKKISVKPVLHIPEMVSSSKGKQEFRTSGILPVNNGAYWLAISTNNKFILQINRNGNIDTLIKLDDDVFVKPEGIALAPDGSLFISNEGKYDKATLLAFKKIN